MANVYRKLKETIWLLGVLYPLMTMVAEVGPHYELFCGWLRGTTVSLGFVNTSKTGEQWCWPVARTWAPECPQKFDILLWRSLKKCALSS